MVTSESQPQTGAMAVASGSPTVIAFATQKGGMGKTTLSVLVASWLHYKRGMKVAILDVDGSQLSVYNQRLREADQIEADAEMAARFDEQHKEPFEILSGTPANVPGLLQSLAADTQVVFIDMPGSIDVDGYEVAIGKLDYLIVPMETSQYAVTTGFSYLMSINQIELLPADRCRVVWNRYKPSRDAMIADQLEERLNQYGYQCLKSRIPQRDSYQDAGNTSTLFPMPTPYLRNSGLKDLFTEIEVLLQTNQQHEPTNK